MLQAMKILDAKAAVDKEWKKFETIPAWLLDKVKSEKVVAGEMGSPRHVLQQAAADSRRSRTCVCANTSLLGWHTQGGKGESTSCRGKYLQRDARREDWAARVGKWSPRGTGMTVLTYPGMRPDNRQGW